MSTNSASVGCTSGTVFCDTICAFVLAPDSMPRLAALLTGPESRARLSAATLTDFLKSPHKVVSARKISRPPSLVLQTLVCHAIALSRDNCLRPELSPLPLPLSTV